MKEKKDEARRSAVAIRFRATKPTTTGPSVAKSWEKLPNVCGRVGRSLACIRSYDRTVQVVTCQFPNSRLHSKVSSMNFIAHLLASPRSRSRIRMRYRFFCWNQNKRTSPPYPYLVSFPIRTTVYPYAKIRLFGRYREGEKRRHREIDNARGNIVARYVSARIPSLTLSTVLDL